MKDSIVNRKIDKDLQKLLNMMGRTLDKYVDNGEEYLKDLQSNISGDEDKAPLVSTYMHILNMVDAISILVKKGATAGIKPLLRSLFESSLYFEYMIQESKEKGVLAYQVSYTNNEIKSRKMLDHNTDSGKQFAKAYENEYGHTVKSYPETESNKYLYQLLEREPYESVNEEWKSKKGNRPQINWYNLYTELRNLRDLSAYLNKEAMYNLLYKDLSNFIHGSQTMKNFKSADGVGILPGIRNVESIENYISFTIGIMSNVYRLISPEKFAEFYFDEIREDYMKISSMNIKVEYYNK